MYFPYLRGKQFELIALRELCALFPHELDKISPVIEPVKSSSTLNTTLTELANRNANFNIIINPRVGDLKSQYAQIVEIISTSVPVDYTNYQLAVIIHPKTETNIEVLIDFLNGLKLNYNGITLIHKTEISNHNIELLNRELNIVYNLIYFSKTSRRYYREFEPATLVSLDDYFEEQSRNADYLNQESDFSNEYRFYQQDGFVGFSDFLTIGDNYSESGFLPRAVAIHLSYVDNDRIKVKHFVSDSNEDVSDIGGKFSEAINKLVIWCDQNNKNTAAINVFRDLQQRGHFPGLGTLKKLSIMNHIELVINNI
ncbi:sce7725 family protein [Gelidibacter salicanalis]|uniref:Sce7725 family protein n=1 Tax=Gelidibacter salicanalis TaxID=291193 RepID=A0A934KWT1_9FLAO|nr:sce7725 family protein [Gelidibacter salicanalis]MBJ7882027.1 sce7725 family protein [Gelidibacter salicanalis]